MLGDKVGDIVFLLGVMDEEVMLGVIYIVIEFWVMLLVTCGEPLTGDMWTCSASSDVVLWLLCEGMDG